MAFAVAGGGKGGKKKGVQPSMNVTPLVDVVLVLLIIFMVITPLLTKQFWLHVPMKDKEEAAEEPPPDRPPVVLTVRADGTIHVNQQAVADAELTTKLQRVFAARGANVLFFEAEDGVEFGRAMEVLDLARAGHAVTIAVLTEPPRTTP